MKSSTRRLTLPVLGLLGATLAFTLLAGHSHSAPPAPAFEAYIIRNGTAPPFAPPVIQSNNFYGPPATEFIIAAGGQKAGLGSSAIDGSALGSITNISIDRLDNRNRFTAGSGPHVAPYLNFWITDCQGHYAVVANEPSDPAFQLLYANGYDLTWADLANKVAKVYENNNLSWLPVAGSSGLPAQAGRQNPLSANMYTFADLAGFIVKAPSVAELTAGWPGLGTGAPRELGSNKAWGVNWVFGDTLSSYVSGAEGYVVADASVTAPAATAVNLIVTAGQAGGALNNLAGVVGDAAPGFPGGSFAAAAMALNAKSQMDFDPVVLFGRAIRLGEVKRISYWTKSPTHTVYPPDWYLVTYTKPFVGDVSTPGWYGSRLGSEPYFSINLADTLNPWNQWTTDGATNQLRFFESTQGAPGATFGSYTDPVWLAFLGGNSLGTTVPRRNQEVHRFSIQTGSAWANGFTGQLDGFKIELANGSVATINFEPDDTDSDGFPDASDNCPTTANADQANYDGDSEGDVCDADDDNDGVADTVEISAGSDPLNELSRPEVCDGMDNDLNDGVDEGFADGDGDGIADCVDPNLNDGPLGDLDNDGVKNVLDNCPTNVNAGQQDDDADGIGDACDPEPFSPRFLVIDEDSIDNGNAPNYFSASAVNDDRSRLAQRTPLRAFDGANIGRTYTLYTGEVGDEGWFALKTIPSSWITAGPTTDGLRNFIGNLALPYPHGVGNGLGTGSDPERWLDKIPNVTPLRAAGLAGLVGMPVCAVVFDSGISINYGPLNGSLKGENLGTVAFRVLSSSPLVGQSSGSLPFVRVQVLNARDWCNRPQKLYQGAP